MRAYCYDQSSVKKQEAIAGGGHHLKDLRHTYSDQPSALRATSFARIKRGSATLTYTLAKGRPELIPELTYTLTGIKPEVDGIIWYGRNVQHNLSAGSGYTISLSLESRLPEGSMADLVEESKGDYKGVVAYYRDEKRKRKRA